MTEPVRIAVVSAATTTAVATTVTLDMNTIILAVISLIGTSVTGFLALRMASLAGDAKETKLATATAAEEIGKIHVAVNSERTVMLDKVDKLTKHVQDLMKQIATLEENKRGAELAKAIASVPPVVVMPAAQAGLASLPSADHSTLKGAIVDLTEAAKDTVVAADKTVDLADKVPLK